MTLNQHQPRPHETAVVQMEAEGGPLLRGAWLDVLMLHFLVPAEDLQTVVPFPLDDYDGYAVLTLVAFHLEDLQLVDYPDLPHWMMAPGEHAFLNVRTYVTVNGEPGIYFIHEYVPKLLARMAGPLLYGLPYRLAPVHYEHDPQRRRFQGRVGSGRRIAFEAEYAFAAEEAVPDTFDEFVLERYNAFGWHWGHANRFRVEHPPWRMHRARLEHFEDGLLADEMPGWDEARLVTAHFTPGFDAVGMGAPTKLVA